MDEPSPTSESQDSPTLRAPTRREQIIAAIVFAIIAGFFVYLFIVWFASKFHWLLLALAVISLIRAVRHALAARKTS